MDEEAINPTSDSEKESNRKYSAIQNIGLIADAISKPCFWCVYIGGQVSLESSLSMSVSEEK